MNAEELVRIKIKAAVYAAIADGVPMGKVLEILSSVRAEIEGEQWRGPGNR